MTTTIDGNVGVTVPTSVTFTGSSSGTTVVQAAAAASGTLTLPATTGTLLVPGNASALTAETTKATTSGTSVEFTGLPSWTRRITWMLSDISTSGSATPLFQLGSTTYTTSGYTCYAAVAGGTNTVSSNNYTTGFGVVGGNAANLYSGTVILAHMGSNLWVCSIMLGVASSGAYYSIGGGGQVTLAGTLDRVRIYTTNGTDTFDAGSVNIIYE